ncbi:secondary thiamine-phosphate synthase enzyme YjbQ [Phenylobacterium sp.]|uniref:secondary thiamine-phosphate synthase enzyme YjbQ n=1 Tax=Phenylobacterium sp. TaxID=1871053 RepID=UPI00393CDB78
MRQAAGTLEVRTPGQGLHAITREVVAWVADQGVTTGLLTVFCRHTSASLLIQENADPDVRRDIEDWVAKVAPESPAYRHQDEGSSPTHPYFAVA